MKLNKLFIFAAASLMLVGCGGGSEMGTKVTEQEFWTEVAKVPATHNFTKATAVRKGNYDGANQTFEFTYSAGQWTSTEGEYTSIGQIINLSIQASLNYLENMMGSDLEYTYCINPLSGSAKSASMVGEAAWNEFGLITYLDFDGTRYGQHITETTRVTYK